MKQQPILLRIGFHIEVVDDFRYSGTSVVNNVKDFLARKSSLRSSHIPRFFHGCFRGTYQLSLTESWTSYDLGTGKFFKTEPAKKNHLTRRSIDLWRSSVCITIYRLDIGTNWSLIQATVSMPKNIVCSQEAMAK